MSGRNHDQVLKEATQKIQREERARNSKSRKSISTYIHSCFSPSKLPPSPTDTTEEVTSLETLHGQEAESTLHDPLNIITERETGPPPSPKVLHKLVQRFKERELSELGTPKLPRN